MIARDGSAHYLGMMPLPLEYSASQGCPTEAEFVAFVTRRGGDFQRPAPNTKARAMTVTLRREGSQYAGALELEIEDTATDARQLRGQACAEVAEALAVVAAIALQGREETPGAPPASAPVAPSATIAKPVNPTGEFETRRPTRLRALGIWRDERLPVTEGSLQVNRSLAATLTGGVVLGAIPGVVLPRYDLTLTRTNFITTPRGDQSFLIGNVFGVRWSMLGLAKYQSGTHSTDMYGIRVGVSSCTSLTYDSEGLVALMCASVMAALMELKTKDSASAYQQRKEVGLGSVSLEMNLRYHFGKYLHVGALVGGEVWLGTLSAQRADGSELFHSRLFNVNAQLGMGVSF